MIPGNGKTGSVGTSGGWSTPFRVVKPGLLGVLFLLLVLSVPRSIAQETDQKIVRELVINGLEQYSQERIRAKLKTRKGAPFNRDTLRNDINRLYNSGLVRKLDWKKEETENGLRIIMNVVENPQIEKVVLKGVTQYSVSNLRNDLELPSASTLTPYLRNRDIETIKSKYREDGYYFVDVRHRLVPGKKGKVLILEVMEGPEVTVHSVKIKGNERISDGEIEGVVESSPGWFWSSNLKKDLIKKDLQNIKNLYRGRGYLDVSVHLEKKEFTPDKSGVHLVFRVNEGERYTIKEVRFKGNTIFSREELLEKISLKPGEPLQMRLINPDQNSIRRLYGRNAYIDTEVSWTYRVAKEKNQVVSIINITEHGRTIAGRIDISGNTKTKDSVIRQRISVVPGKPIDLVKMRRSLNNLRKTRYFENVSIKKNDTDKPNVKDLEVQVKEKPTGQIRLGGGFSSDFGAVGTFSIKQNNFDISRTPDSFGDTFSGKAFAGAGQTFSLNLRPGVEQSNYSINFREPYLYDQPLGFGVGARNSRLERDDFDEERLGGNIDLDYRGYEPWTYSLELEGENIEITDVTGGSPADIRDIEGDHDLYSATPQVTLNMLEPKLNPERGYFIKGGYQHSVGDFEFGKLETEFRKYFPIYDPPKGGTHILSFRSSVGLGESYLDDKDIPSFERFYAGGTGTLRGFDFRGVGPRVGDVEIGGDARWLSTLEYTFPLVRRRSRRGGKQDVLRGAFFVDSGTVAREKRDFENNIRVSTGFGIRVKVPGMGPVPIKIDVGIPLKQQEKDDNQTLHFELGARF